MLYLQSLFNTTHCQINIGTNCIIVENFSLLKLLLPYTNKVLIKIQFHFQCFLISLLYLATIIFILFFFAGTQDEAINTYEIWDQPFSYKCGHELTMCSYDVHNILLSITLAIFVAATQFKDADHVEMTQNRHKIVDDMTPQLKVGFIQLGRMEEHITYIWGRN